MNAAAELEEPLPESPLNLTELETRTRDDLLEVAKELGLSGTGSLRKQDIVFRILQARAESEGNYFAGGILEMAQDGYGFLRADRLRPGLGGIYVSPAPIPRFAPRPGAYRVGPAPQ